MGAHGVGRGALHDQIEAGGGQEVPHRVRAQDFAAQAFGHRCGQPLHLVEQGCEVRATGLAHLDCPGELLPYCATAEQSDAGRHDAPPFKCLCRSVSAGRVAVNPAPQPPPVATVQQL